MNKSLKTLEIRLKSNQPLRLPAAPGHHVHGLEGRIWLTGGGLTGDVYLLPGESVVLKGTVPCLAEAIGTPTASLAVESGLDPLGCLGDWLNASWNRARQKAGIWWLRVARFAEESKLVP